MALRSVLLDSVAAPNAAGADLAAMCRLRSAVFALSLFSTQAVSASFCGGHHTISTESSQQTVDSKLIQPIR